MIDENDLSSLKTHFRIMKYSANKLIAAVIGN